ncbi:MAG: DNRLRE domain-containing protein [Clostridia bacterium]|nr:DNRLRE domain-containing protein [Clostridia bacterium]
MMKRFLTAVLLCAAICGITACTPDTDPSEGETNMTDEVTEAPKSENAPPAYIDIEVSEDCTVRGGKYSNDNYGKEATVDIKGTSDDYARKAYLKFSLKELEFADPLSVTLELASCSGQTVEKKITLIVRAVDAESWSESTLTFANRPRSIKKLSEIQMYAKQTCSVDVTEYVKEAIAEGKTEIAFMLDGSSSEGWKLSFNSKESSASSPRLRFAYTDMSLYYGRAVKLPTSQRYGAGNDPFEWADKLVNEYFASRKTEKYDTEEIKNDPSEYTVSVQARDDVNSSYKAYKLRTLDTLKGFTATAHTLDKYGGSTALKLTKTGFFHTERVGERWYLVTPEGNAYFDAAVANVTASNASEGAKTAFKELYGTEQVWAKKTVELLKDNGFYSMGGWSKPHEINTGGSGLNYSEIIYFMSSYGEAYKLTADSAGHDTFINNNTIPVFDPDFVTVADRLAKAAAKDYGDDPYLIGYMSDNELPCDKKMLDNYLTLDWSNVYNSFSYAAAWVWLEKATGKENPSLADVNDTLRDEFREFVYDRYFKVVSEALKEHDPNHLYLGCRFMKEANLSEGIFRAAGRYCDAISVNYYLDLDPSGELIAQWISASGKPFVITEVYTKADDSGLPNTAGAGKIVKTQADRGIFYQNFMLKMLESKYCVGVHWFKYRDNDPQNKNAEASNTDANKGIVGVDYSPYTDLLEAMKEINNSIYSIIDHFGN